MSAPAAPAAAAAALPTASALFGCVVSGRAVTTSFSELVPGSRYTLEVPSPATAASLTIFLLPGVALPADRGITVLWSAPPHAEWTPLGVLTPAAPSATFRTGWPAALAPPAPQPPPAALLLGLAVEPLDAVASVAGALSAGEEDQLATAQLVARDLYTFLSSFCVASPVGERVVMPMTAIDRWLAKFADKYRHDKGFLLKRSSL